MRFTKSIVHACQGLIWLARHERNFKIHLIITGLVLLASIQLPLEKAIIIYLLMGFVLFGEAVNTAIEKVVDLCSPDYHPLAKLAKDIAAASVLIVAITALLIGIILCYDHYF